MSQWLAFTLSALAVLNYIAAAEIVNSPPDSDRSYFSNRKWSLDVSSNSAFLVVRHWRTVNTADIVFCIDLNWAVILAIGPLVIMYLCYRCGLVKRDQLAATPHSTDAPASPP